MSGEEKDETVGGHGSLPEVGETLMAAADDQASAPPPPLGLRHPRFNPRDAFVVHHGAIRAGLEDHPFPGFLAAVADGEHLETLWIAASDDAIRAAIIGRHSRATLALPREHASAALRHLALLVRSVEGRPTARLLDLQTEIGFADPLGRRFEAVRTDGPTFLSAGGAVLMMFPTGPDVRISDDPEQAWSEVPPRRWLESSVDRPQPAHLTDASTVAGETLVRSEDGPRGCRARLCRPHEIPVGLVTVAASGEQTDVRVSGRALDEGFLIGRYDRCEMGGPEADESLSRVHLLIVREGRKIIAIDTASTNGTYVGDERVHLVEFVENSKLDLGGVLDLTWRTCN